MYLAILLFLKITIFKAAELGNKADCNIDTYKLQLVPMESKIVLRAPYFTKTIKIRTLLPCQNKKKNTI